MAILLSHSLCYHIPKTGGQWVYKALQNAGVPYSYLYCNRSDCLSDRNKNEVRSCCKHAHANEIQLPRGETLFSFVFVRNPFQVYQSFWCYKMSNKWIWEDPFDNEYGIGDFPSFVCAITRRRPGWISEQYKRYIGPKGAPLVSFVGRQEFLVDDLVHALTLAGETFDEVALRNTPKVNQVATLSAWKDKAVFTSELIDLVRESEREALERFDYDYEYVSPLFENLLSPKKEALLVR